MAKAIENGMTYYEKLVKKMNHSMAKNPRSAIVMNLSTFQVIAKGNDLDAVSKKMVGKTYDNTIVFQKPNQRASWIL